MLVWIVCGATSPLPTFSVDREVVHAGSPQNILEDGSDYSGGSLMMTAADVREWMLVVSGSITLLSVAVSSWLALRQYRLKLKEEERLSVSARTETDIRLVKAFSELMEIAHARSGHVLSEKTVESLFSQNAITEKELADPKMLNHKLETAAVFTLPVGLAAQDAAIAAIVTLGARHEVLMRPALQALETMKSFKPEIASKYLQQLAETAEASGS
jgi:hypothetical protein